MVCPFLRMQLITSATRTLENLLTLAILQEELTCAGVLPEDYDLKAHKKLVPMRLVMYL